MTIHKPCSIINTQSVYKEVKMVRFKHEDVLDYLRRNKMTRIEFCKKCGISYYSFKKLMSNDFNVDVRIFLKICIFLCKAPYELLEENDMTK